jgi:hypothetical protein
MSELEALGPADLDQRLGELVDGRVLRIRNDSCPPAFPVIEGVERKEFTEVADAAAAALGPVVETIVARLRKRLGGREEMLFHLLWSRVIDEVWEEAWELASLDGDLPALAWVVYPEHQYAVGTNYDFLPGDASLAVTWSRAFMDHLSSFSDLNWEIIQVAWGETVAASEATAALTEYGIFDAEGRSRLFSYPQGERLDSLMTELTKRYAEGLAQAVDWAETARRFDVHHGDFFVALSHEIAYAVFDDLLAAGSLDVPSAVLDATDRSQAVRLVSVARGRPLEPMDEAMAAYMSGQFQMGQYNIGPVTAKEWARQRVLSPF